MFEADAESFHIYFFSLLIRRRTKRKRFYLVGPEGGDDDDGAEDEDEDEAVPGNSKRKALGLCKGILARCFPSFRSKASFSATLNKTAAPRASNGPVTCGGTPGICCCGLEWVGWGRVGGEVSRKGWGWGLCVTTRQDQQQHAGFVEGHGWWSFPAAAADGKEHEPDPTRQAKHQSKTTMLQPSPRK